MTLTAMLAVATVALGAGGALLATRYLRDASDTVRALARRGTHIRLISRQTRLPQDVVTMMIAGMAASAPAARQKVPAAAVYAPTGAAAHRTQDGKAIRNPLHRNGLRG